MRILAFAGTLALSALLVFAVQPMAGKALLPVLGGVPAAWIACLLFFQAALLVGYTYVWAGAKLSPRARLLVHLVLLLVTLVFASPFASGDAFGISATEHPALYVVLRLTRELGPAFVLLSATTPLLSYLFAFSRHPQAASPYFLYAASNAGSLLALLAYPFALEPFWDLDAQRFFFRVGFGLVALAIAVTGLSLWRRLEGEPAAPKVDEPKVEDEAAARPPTWPRRSRWVLFAFVPTALLAGASAQLSLDVAPLPLLWVLPLALYLVSFILAFASRVPAPPTWVGRGTALLCVVLIFSLLTHANEPLWVLVLLHLAVLFSASWIAHRRLHDAAPAAKHLPEFYVWVALGGVLGTLFTAIIAPLVLPDVWEYPAALALATALRPRGGVVRPDGALSRDLVFVALVAGVFAASTLAVRALGEAESDWAPMLTYAPALLLAYRFMPLRRRFALALLALVALGASLEARGELLYRSRGFFGVLRVIDREGEAGRERHLLHGTTSHGSQRLGARGDCEPGSYYQRRGPLGWIFEAHRSRGLEGPILAIGLGTGSVACYAEPGERWRFVEIHPDVIAVAQNPAFFTYLVETPTDAIELELGDGRIGVESQPEGALALIIVDAFNSDAVPVHLLTREALRLYASRLAPGGWALLHLSNRVLDLEGVLGDAAAAEGLVVAVSRSDAPGAEVATWAVLARREADLTALGPRFVPLSGVPQRAWTDRHSSLLGALR